MVGSYGHGLLPEDELPGGDVPGGHDAPAHPRPAGHQEGQTLAPVLVQSSVLVTAEAGHKMFKIIPLSSLQHLTRQHLGQVAVAGSSHRKQTSFISMICEQNCLNHSNAQVLGIRREQGGVFRFLDDFQLKLNLLNRHFLSQRKK